MAKKDMFKMCTALLEEHRFHEARFLLTSYIESRTDLGRYFAFASDCCDRLGWHRQASDLATAGITFDPGNAQVWYNASSSLRKMGHTAEARAIIHLGPERARARWSNIVHSPKLKKDLAFLTFRTGDPSLLIWEEVDTGQLGPRLRSLSWHYWRNKKYETAVHVLKVLIWSTSEEAKLALMMRCTCHHHFRDYALAATDATVALMIDPGNDLALRSEAFLNRKNALAEMGQSKAAKQMDDFSDAYFSQIRQRSFETKVLSSLRSKESKGTSTLEDEYIEKVSGKSAGEDENYGLVEMMLRTLPASQRELLVDDRVPPLHVEFANGPALRSSNQAAAMKWLQGAYVKSLTAMHNLRYMQLGLQGDMNAAELPRRLGPNKEKSMKWWESARIGDIESQRAKSIYPPDLLHTYSNVNPMQISLAFGQCHIAVGHVDLGVLLSAEYVGNANDGPIEFYGYEASPYAVARTKILYQMLKDGADVDSILQVGYSSGWSLGTLAAFQQSLSSVLGQEKLPSEVHSILVKWRSTPDVDLLQSQESWLKLHENERYAPANILCQKDRLEVMHYVVSGRLLECAVGSTTMFVLPPEYPHIANDETVFATVFPEQLAQEYKTYQSTIGTIIGILRCRIKNLRDKVLARQITIDSKLKRINLTSFSDLMNIRNRAPHSMSWSNLCDHMTLEDYHQMLTACSTSKTVHHMHSMNWLKDVKGCFLCDYEHVENQMSMAEKYQKQCSNLLLNHFGRHIFQVPPVELPQNVFQTAAPQFAKQWVEYFSRSGSCKINILSWKAGCWTPVGGSSTLYISLSYEC